MFMNNCVNQRKAVIIGCGFVGSSSAFALMQSGLFSEIVLIDVDQKRAEGEAMDISHGVPFVHPMNIYAGDYKDITDAALIVVTAGAAQKPGETRLDLIKKNIAIFGSILFGGLYILNLYIPGAGMAIKELYKMLPYVATILVLIITSMRRKREHQPPESLGLPYFREDR